jgi:3-phenylpropionate/trans-cinnamate dioxygenase ferredoxin reductase subunit
MCTDRLVPYAPYQRPPLSKAFLSGTAEAATLQFRLTEHYEQDRITLLTGQRVTGVRAAAAGPAG